MFYCLINGVCFSVWQATLQMFAAIIGKTMGSAEAFVDFVLFIVKKIDPNTCIRQKKIKASSFMSA